MNECRLQAPLLCISCDQMAASCDFACPRCSTRKARDPRAFWTEVNRRAQPSWKGRLPAWRQEFESRLHSAVRDRIQQESVRFEVFPRESEFIGRFSPSLDGPHQIQIWSRLSEVEAKETFAHEMAHFVAFQAFGADGHGDLWSRIQWGFGYLPGRSGRIYEYSWNRLRRRLGRPSDGKSLLRAGAGIRTFRLSREPGVAVLDGAQLERVCDWFGGLPDEKDQTDRTGVAELAALSRRVLATRVPLSQARVELSATHALQAASWYRRLPWHCREEADRRTFQLLTD